MPPAGHSHDVSSVRNPNFFSVAFKSITANVSYPINNTQIGGGSQDNVVFASNSKTSFTFPFTIEYSQAKDPQGAILTDIATKCGFIPGSAKTQLSLGYSLTVRGVLGLGRMVTDKCIVASNTDIIFYIRAADQR